MTTPRPLAPAIGPIETFVRDVAEVLVTKGLSDPSQRSVTLTRTQCRRKLRRNCRNVVTGTDIAATGVVPAQRRLDRKDLRRREPASQRYLVMISERLRRVTRVAG